VGITYDSADRRSVLTLPDGVTATYTYDAGSHLTGLSYQLGGTAIGDLIYTYDALGRVTQESGSLARAQWPSVVSSATYDAANELTSWNGTALTYDADGNMTSDGSRTFRGTRATKW
jgi:YD repeat-containing protein